MKTFQKLSFEIQINVYYSKHLKNYEKNNIKFSVKEN